MVEKKFCDKCGKDITRNCSFQLEVYDDITEKYILDMDLCDGCKTKIIKKIKEKIRL